MLRKLSLEDSALDFVYRYLDTLVVADKSFNKLFEVGNIKKYFYILS